MIPAALATQTGGPITRPASFCGVYGLKPTFSRVSLNGVVPLSTSLDHGGVIAASVRDSAAVLQAMAAETVGPGVIDFGAKIGQRVPNRLVTLGGYFVEKADPVMKAAFDALLGRLVTQGWQVYSRPLPMSFQDVPKNHRTIMAVEAARFHGERWKRYPGDYPPKFTALVEQGLSTPAPDYLKAMDHLKAVRHETAGWVGAGQTTLIVPATVGPAPDPSTIGDPLFQAPWSYCGLPTVSFPFAWTADGLPLCAQVVGAAWCEDDLLAVAAALEAEIKFEPRPLGCGLLAEAYAQGGPAIYPLSRTRSAGVNNTSPSPTRLSDLLCPSVPFSLMRRSSFLQGVATVWTRDRPPDYDPAMPGGAGGR